MSSPLFRLPLELRLDIYDLVLQHETEVTIATVPDPSYKAPIPGMPQGHRPIMVPGFDEDLLSFTKFAPQQWKSPKRALTALPQGRLPSFIKPGTRFGQASSTSLRPGLSRNSSFESSASMAPPMHTAPPTPAENEQSGYAALLFTCQQIRSELTTHLAVRWQHPLLVHVSYPFGALALSNMYYPLIPATKSINMCGFHAPLTHTLKEEDLAGTARHFDVEDWLALDGLKTIQNEFGPEPPTIGVVTDELARQALKDLLYDVFNSPKGRNFEAFTLRMFSPTHRDWRHSIAMNNTEWEAMIQAENEVCDYDYDYDEDGEELETRYRLTSNSWMWKGRGGAAYVKRVAKIRGKPRSSDLHWPSFHDRYSEDWMGIVTGARDRYCPIKEYRMGLSAINDRGKYRDWRSYTHSWL
jgi:hypothetical protein